ncbi:glycoside hydrolase family 15 protein [Patescibacteria group bacterium]|jgi:GH15 family glucan-1,4-alpha-glucosidase|nr:glycoside hydrolase family 15 protein [Patescibacteria group bacterium]
MAYTPIRDYALITNRRSAVLVSKHGSIDWAPAPFIDSPSVFGAILDENQGGYWRIRPTEDYAVEQFYVDRTNVLVTEFTTASGVLEVTDYLPLEEEKCYVPAAEDTTFKIKRRVRCLDGEVEVEMLFEPRFDYGRGTTRMSPIERGIYATHEDMHGVLVIHQDYDLNESTGLARSVFTLARGESDFIVFRYNAGDVDLLKDDNEHHEEELELTIAKHRHWCDKYDLPNEQVPDRWRNQVLRSKLVLKALFFEPVGTIAAAPTTSLPEWIGGVRNWDYRFTWIRDSSFVLDAFFKLGHTAEAEQYLNWLMNICAIEGPENLKIMYGMRSEIDLDERILPHLEGYRHSKPVRIGNGAHTQRQWDIYGSVLNVAYKLAALKRQAPDVHRWRVFRDLADHVCRSWQEPDEGLWEVRGGAKRFTYSAVMNWVALDRSIDLAEQYDLPGDIELWRAERRHLRDAIMTLGWSEEKQAFTQAFGTQDLDAAILLMPVVGFIEGSDPRFVSTIRAIERELLVNRCLVLRYTAEDGLPGREGAFLLSSFWYVDALALAGELPKAIELFEELLSFANHVGLYSEEMHPDTHEFLGNFPQAYTHIGLINSALLLERLRRNQ